MSLESQLSQTGNDLGIASMISIAKATDAIWRRVKSFSFLDIRLSDLDGIPLLPLHLRLYMMQRSTVGRGNGNIDH